VRVSNSCRVEKLFVLIGVGGTNTLMDDQCSAAVLLSPHSLATTLSQSFLLLAILCQLCPSICVSIISVNLHSTHLASNSPGKPSSADKNGQHQQNYCEKLPTSQEFWSAKLVATLSPG
jgi:hypothetical protein